MSNADKLRKKWLDEKSALVLKVGALIETNRRLAAEANSGSTGVEYLVLDQNSDIRRT